MSEPNSNKDGLSKRRNQPRNSALARFVGSNLLFTAAALISGVALISVIGHRRLTFFPVPGDADANLIMLVVIPAALTALGFLVYTADSETFNKAAIAVVSAAPIVTSITNITATENRLHASAIYLLPLIGIAYFWSGRIIFGVLGITLLSALAEFLINDFSRISINDWINVSSVFIVVTFILFSAQGREERDRRRFKAIQSYDPHTGTHSRTEYDRIISRAESETTAGHSTRLAITTIHIQDFTSYNHRYGFEAGDAILSKTAEIVKAFCAESFILCRISGAEFAVLQPDVPLVKAAEFSNNVAAAISNYKFRVGAETELPFKIQPQVSVGHFPDIASSPSDLYSTAFEANRLTDISNSSQLSPHITKSVGQANSEPTTSETLSTQQPDLAPKRTTPPPHQAGNSDERC